MHFKHKFSFPLPNSPPGQIRRGASLPYYSAGDDRLFEYVDSRVVFEKDSKWQNIKIIHTEEFGHVLCLDDDISKLGFKRLEQV